AGLYSLPSGAESTPGARQHQSPGEHCREGAAARSSWRRGPVGAGLSALVPAPLAARLRTLASGAEPTASEDSRTGNHASVGRTGRVLLAQLPYLARSGHRGSDGAAWLALARGSGAEHRGPADDRFPDSRAWQRRQTARAALGARNRATAGSLSSTG